MKFKGVFLAAILAVVLCISGNLFAYSGGDGSAGNPYQIANVTDFQQLSATSTDWSLSFILTVDIDLTDPTFTQSPIAPDANSATVGFQGTQFTGVFDGNGFTISNLTITASTKDYIGLFGYVGSGGQILNLSVKNISITGRNFVGGLVGYNNGGVEGHPGRGGTLTSCYAIGSVVGTVEFVGGLVGYFLSGTATSCYAIGSVSGSQGVVGGLVGYIYSGSLTSCYATVSVNGGYMVGGLVGEYDNGILTACYATGSVSGTEYVGGLTGTNGRGKVIQCYSTGSVSGTGYDVGGLVGRNDGSVSSSFWDMQTSGKTTSAGGTGKTTVQMQTLATFTDAGWDFVNTWWMPDGNYPRLISLPLTLSIQANPSFITSVSPLVGQHTVFGAVNISARSFIQCPDTYHFDHWEGDVDDPNSAETSVFMDSEKTITAVFTATRECGDECHDDNVFGDYNHDCLIDITDFAQFALNWLTCTKPECD